MREQLKVGILTDLKIATHLLLENEGGDPSFFYSSVITNFCFGLEKLIKLVLLHNNPLLLLKKISPTNVIMHQRDEASFSLNLNDSPFAIIECGEAWARLSQLIDSETIRLLDRKMEMIRSIRNNHKHCCCNIAPKKLARIAKLDCWIIAKALLELLPKDLLNPHTLFGQRDYKRLQDLFESENTEEIAAITNQYAQWEHELRSITPNQEKIWYLYSKVKCYGDVELRVECPICKLNNAYCSFYDEAIQHENESPIYFLEFFSFICIHCGIASSDRWELAQIGVWNNLRDITFRYYENEKGHTIFETCTADKANYSIGDT